MKQFMGFTFLILFSSCVENSGILTKAASPISKGQVNCAAPDATEVGNIRQRLAASSVEVGTDFCQKVENYECYARKFSPLALDAVNTVEECASVSDLGGEVCLKLRSQTYNTREASRMAGVASSASIAGGEFNRSEYVCHHRELRDGETFLAVGEGESLRDALMGSLGKCSGLAPRLSVTK